MHALHLPFTGIFLGGFSVLIISLIAHFEKKVFESIVKATLIVMAVKASVNPMTSPMAYVAVGFQGLCGALFYSIKTGNLVVSVLFAMIAMLESAFQKLLIITLFFGTSWMNALDAYYHSISKNFGVNSDSEFSLYFVIFYVSVYFLWGLLLGIWAHRLPLQIEERKNLYKELQAQTSNEKTNTGRKKSKKLMLFAAVLLFILSFFLPEADKTQNTLLIVFRTVIVVLIWIFVLMPLWRKWILKWLNERQQKETPEVLARMPLIASYSRPLLNDLKTRFRGVSLWKEYVIGLIVISLHKDEQ